MRPLIAMKNMPGIVILVTLSLIFGILAAVPDPQSPGVGLAAGDPATAGEPIAPSAPNTDASGSETSAPSTTVLGADGQPKPVAIPGAATTNNAPSAPTPGQGGPQTTTANPSSPGAAPTTETLGRGVFPDRIKIGYLVPDRDWDGLFTALGTAGSKSAGFGDQRAMMEAVIKDMNANGGVAGRRIEPFYFTYSFNRTVTPDSAAAQAREACTYWTQDNPVFAVVQVGFESWPISNCLTERGVLHYNTSTYISAQHFNKIPDFYENPGYNSLDRQATDYVYGLDKQGFFAGRTGFPSGGKIGLVYYDQNSDFAEAIKGGLEPALAERGLVVTKKAVGNASSDFTNMVVQFRQAGVTHVLFFVSTPVVYALFMQAAENQRYNPWYGISTAAGPGVLLQGIAPPQQLVKSMGPGWDPSGDVEASQNPYKPSSTDTRCLNLMQRAGLSSNDPLIRGLQLAMCTLNWFMGESGDRARPVLTAQSFTQTSGRFGAEFNVIRERPFPARYTPDRVNNGVASFRPLIFDAACACFKYEGDVQPMP